MSGDDLFTRGEVALRLRTSERTVGRLAKAGQLEEVWIAPRTPRIIGESVETYLKRIRGQLAEPTAVA